VGLREQVMRDALPMSGRLIHDEAGDTTFSPYSADGTRSINSISRSALNDTLLDAALESDLVSAVFDHRLTTLDVTSGDLEFETPDGEVRVAAGVVIGADGAYSAVRSRLLATPGFDYRQDYLACQYKELTIPPRNDDFALDPAALHIWPRGGSMMIALPNPDKSFTCTLFWPPTGPDSFEATRTGTAALDYFARRYTDAVPLMPELAAEFDANPIGNLVTVRCSRWSANGRVALIGDAAHAITPFFGQGANAGFEDVVELDRCLGEAGGDWAAALPEYESRRVDNANAIADMALENFVDMSTKSASRVAHATKSLQHGLHRLMPEHYSTRYELVSFSTIPYAEVVRRTSPAGQTRSVARGLAHKATTPLKALTGRGDKA
jgi:kynurenine 3-monooxygenase